MTTYTFCKLQVGEYEFRAILGHETLSFTATGGEQQVVLPLDHGLEMVIRDDAMGVPHLGLEHPACRDRFLLDGLSGSEIAQIRKTFGIAIKQDYRPELCPNTFLYSVAWDRLQENYVVSEMTKKAIRNQMTSPNRGTRHFAMKMYEILSIVWLS